MLTHLLILAVIIFISFIYRFLPSIVKEENESESQTAERAAKVIAADLGIAATQHTASDKAEYEKRYLLEQSQPITVRPTSSTELQRMARQVGEVLPYVPHDVIVRDLGEFYDFSMS